MNPAARLSVALLVGLVLWMPTFGATMRGDVDLPESAVRYLVAFLFARVAVAGLCALIRGYAVAQDEGRVPAEDTVDGRNDELPRRRGDSVPTASGLA
jgi:hypothetical protein